MDVERAIEFLVEHQVSQAARLTELMAMQKSMAEVQLRTMENVERLSARVDQIGAHVDQIGAHVDQLTADVAGLREAQSHTDQRMNALIEIVDELIRRPKQ